MPIFFTTCKTLLNNLTYINQIIYRLLDNLTNRDEANKLMCGGRPTVEITSLQSSWSRDDGQEDDYRACYLEKIPLLETNMHGALLPTITMCIK